MRCNSPRVEGCQGVRRNPIGFGIGIGIEGNGDLSGCQATGDTFPSAQHPDIEFVLVLVRVLAEAVLIIASRPSDYDHEHQHKHQHEHDASA